VIEECDFVIEECDFVIEECDFVIEECDFVIEECDFVPRDLGMGLAEYLLDSATYSSLQATKQEGYWRPARRINSPRSANLLIGGRETSLDRHPQNKSTLRLSSYKDQTLDCQGSTREDQHYPLFLKSIDC
jgi:hypothetical protein